MLRRHDEAVMTFTEWGTDSLGGGFIENIA